MFDFSINQPLLTTKLALNQLLSQDYLLTLRQWLNNLEIHHESMAHFLCRLIPTQCPFERDLYLFGRKIAHIPPLCKLNPLY